MWLHGFFCAFVLTPCCLFKNLFLCYLCTNLQAAILIRLIFPNDHYACRLLFAEYLSPVDVR